VNVLRRIWSFLSSLPLAVWGLLAAAIGILVGLWRRALSRTRKAEEEARVAKAQHEAAAASRDRVIDLVKQDAVIAADAAEKHKTLRDATAAIHAKTEAAKAEARTRAEEIAAAADDESLANLLNQRRGRK
jgi:hypothetical protein